MFNIAIFQITILRRLKRQIAFLGAMSLKLWRRLKITAKTASHAKEYWIKTPTVSIITTYVPKMPHCHSIMIAIRPFTRNMHLVRVIRIKF